MSVAPASLQTALTRLTGFSIDPRRADSIADRVAPVIAAHGVRDGLDLMARLRPGADTPLATALVDAMVIKETLFFRDRAPWDALRGTILPDLIAARRDRKRLRLWSAACSTGQEPYSLAMLLDEETRALTGWTVDIVATDLSRTALTTARAGIYSHFEVQRGLSTNHLLRHFRKVPTGWEISDALRAAVTFSERNLMDEYRSLGTFDIVCCRNVMLYMDVERRRDIFSRLAQIIAPDGYLVLGAAETIIGLTEAFAPYPGSPSVFIPARAVREAA